MTDRTAPPESRKVNRIAALLAGRAGSGVAGARPAGRRDDAMRAGTIARVAAVGLVCALLPLGGLRPIQDALESLRFALVTRPPSGQLVMVDIDERSVKAVGVWPWSRSVHAAIVDRLRALEAADIAFDVDFSSSSAMAGDADFEAALKRADGTVILAALQQESRGQDGGGARLESRPLARFAANAWEGSVNVWPSPDGSIRWFSRGERFGSTLVPSLSALLGSGSGQAEGRFLVDYGIDATRLAHVSAIDLLNGAVSPDRIRGRKAIVGATAVELRDFFTVPRFGLMAGAAVQAMAVESLLQNRALQPLGLPLTLALTGLVLAGVAAAGRRLPYAGFLTFCALAGCGVEAGAVLLQVLRPLVAVTAPVHAGLLCFAAIAVATELFQRRVRLQASRRNANRLRVMLDRVVADNAAGIVVVDQDGAVCAASAAAGVILGSALEPSPGRRFDAMLPAPLATLVAEAIAQAVAGAPNANAATELVLTLAHRQLILECITTVSTMDPVTALPSGAPEFAVCLTFQDITEKRGAELRLAEMARVDALSGLANRHVCLDRLDGLRTQSPSGVAALIFFDLDRFKLVNDQLGHAAGDTLIKAVADRVRPVLAPGDTAARLGGDEFALVVERPSQQEAVDFAAVLLRTLGGSYELGSYRRQLDVSVGLAFAEGQDTTQLMSCADAALYAAKAAGGACVKVYDGAMQAAIEDGKRLEEDLRDALRRRDLQVFYQRQVDIGDERIIGVEALVRWRHPERGFVSPATFIPIAERTGLIEQLGAWVLQVACRDAASWPLAIKVSVNLSAVQLACADLADTVLAALRDSGLPARRLDLELTESLLMDDDDLVRATLDRLRDAGVQTSLDDFGTGYSSLSYLKTFPIDKVKIDQSFVRDLGHDPSSAAIIRAVVSLARDLGLRVNAEGIETVEQMQLLRRLGCHEVQGYLHGRPEPSAAIHASLLEQLSKRAA